MRLRATDRLLACFALCLGVSAAQADNAVVPDLPPPSSAARPPDGALRLEVRLRGRTSGVIVEARRASDSAMQVKGADLRQAGLLIPGSGDDEWVRLDAVAGLNCRYVEAEQALDCNAPDWLLAPKIYNVASVDPPLLKASSDYGAAVNYDLYTGAANWSAGSSPRYSLSTAALTLDARVFSPYATMRQTGMIGEGLPTGGSSLRYDTTLEFVDDDRLLAARAGDVVSGGLDRTRPLRLGGLQISSDFGPRPDLVLHPMPSIGGSAAVPTSVDVYMNDFKAFSQTVDPGPFRIANLPAIGEGGTASLVLRDPSGRETRIDAPYYVSPKLLSQGLLSYDLDAGWARTQYGETSFSYAPKPVGEATLRYGLRDTLTLEGHAEGGAGLVNGGGGAAVNMFGRGVVDAAWAGSAYPGARGFQLSLGAGTTWAGFDLDVSSQRAFGAYLDLAAVTAPRTVAAPSALTAALGGWLTGLGVDPPRALDRVSLGYGDAHRLGRFTATLTSIEAPGAADQRLLSLGYSHALLHDGTVMLSGFAGSIGGARTAGVLAALTWNFGGGVSASAQTGRDASGLDEQIQIVKTGDESVGSSSWRATASDSASGLLDAEGVYVSRYARLEASASRSGPASAASTQASADVQGSLAFVGGQVAAGPPLRGSFALVDAGAPGVAITSDNRPAGAADMFGRLLVPDLRAFDTHAIAVDPLTAPADAQFAKTQETVRLRPDSGVLVDLKATRHARDAELRLVDASGKPIEAGSTASVNGGEPSLVGYDGRVYVAALADHNRGVVSPGGCVFAFDDPADAAKGAVRPTIGPIPCRAPAVAERVP